MWAVDFGMTILAIVGNIWFAAHYTSRMECKLDKVMLWAMTFGAVTAIVGTYGRHWR